MKGNLFIYVSLFILHQNVKGNYEVKNINKRRNVIMDFKKAPQRLKKKNRQIKETKLPSSNVKQK